MTSNQNYLEIHCLQNLTTEFELIKDLKATPLEVLEFDDRSFAFQGPAKICGIGTFIHLEGALFISGKKNDFLATAKLVSSAPIGDKLFKYTLELTRFDKPLWESFRKSVEHSQIATDTLFQSMRDHD